MGKQVSLRRNRDLVADLDQPAVGVIKHHPRLDAAALTHSHSKPDIVLKPRFVGQPAIQPRTQSVPKRRDHGPFLRSARRHRMPEERSLG
ncbi:hypothetical protein D3C73_1462010 [compost metagenome]